MSVLHLRCCGPLRVSAKLGELTLDEIESKMVIERRDIDVESKAEYGFGASEQSPCPHCEITNHPLEMFIPFNKDCISAGLKDIRASSDL